MTTIQVIAIVLCVLIIVRSIYNILNLRLSVYWLSHTNIRLNKQPSTRFIVCIPALEEQKVIESTLNKFLEQNYPQMLLSIYVVTTNKEHRVKGQPSTERVIQYYRKHLDKERQEQLQVINYPKKTGWAAHQINYLASLLAEELRKPNTYFVIYNADSNILSDTFRKTDAQVVSIRKRRGKSPALLQQSALYQYGNSHGFLSSISEGAGVHQSLWTLMHEIPRLLRQSSGLEKLKNSSNPLALLLNSRISHCVGHGLFIRGDYYLQHPFSEDILNEDLPYGLLACAIREPIYPIPSLELASTPARLRAVYKQKSTWFNPFFEFYPYGKYLLRTGQYSSKFELSFLIVQAYISLLIWLFHTLILVGGLIFSMIAGISFVIFWLIAFSLYWLIPAFYITGYRHQLKNGGANTYKSVLCGSLYALSHSVGPLWGVVRWMRASVLGIQPDKPKTETV